MDTAKLPVAAQVQQEAIRQFAVRVGMSTRTSILGYGLQALLLRGYVADRLLLIWVLCLMFFELLNGVIAWQTQWHVAHQELRRKLLWAQSFGLFLTSSCWGMVALMPGTDALPMLNLFNLSFLVIVGLFSVHNLCLYWPAMSLFTMGLIWPALWLGLRLNSEWTWVISGSFICNLIFTQLYGRTTRDLVLGGIRSRFATETLAIELRQKNEELTQALTTIERMASLDPLTLCLNRRALTTKLDESVQRQRAGDCFGIILMDIDHFKQINDSYGHAVGDTVLVAFAERVRTQLRPQDYLARWGGEEFLCLINAVQLPALLSLAERIRAELESSALLPPPSELRTTASLGIALCTPGQSVEAAIESADQAMYQAKRLGRNRVHAGSVAVSQPTALQPPLNTS
jgi:diguanylate cyclase (GGDEF)-like protein